MSERTYCADHCVDLTARDLSFHAGCRVVTVAEPVTVECLRCGHILVDRDEVGWYYQLPVTSPEAPGLTFMDRVHECEGQPHLLGDGVAERAEAAEKARQAAETERYKAWLAAHRLEVSS